MICKRVMVCRGGGSSHGLGEANISCQTGNLASISFRMSLFMKYSSFTCNLGEKASAILFK